METEQEQQLEILLGEYRLEDQELYDLLNSLDNRFNNRDMFVSGVEDYFEKYHDIDMIRVTKNKKDSSITISINVFNGQDLTYIMSLNEFYEDIVHEYEIEYMKEEAKITEPSTSKSN